MTHARVVHADWSKDARKRWVARARRGGDGWTVEAVQRWSASTSPLGGLGLADGGGPALIGVDFPIGVPRAYAEAAGIESFGTVLPELGHGRWARFYEVAETREEISAERPFYPRAAGPAGTVSRAHLEAAHGAAYAKLLRLCERETPDRRAACCLFWTLGANQVGKGAIAGWQELVLPLVSGHDAAIWPFDGRLAELAHGRRLTLAETYPAEYYARLGFPRHGWSKRDPDGRRERAAAILNAAEGLRADMAPGVRAAVEDGFGPSPVGEDAFDALVGLLGMLLALRNGAESPPIESVQRIEGWILGRPCSPRAAATAAWP